MIRGIAMGSYFENFKKGYLDMILLKILSVNDCYGYEFTQLFSEITNNVFVFSPAAMYPALYRLEEKGFIECYEKNISKRMKRKYYHLTGRGKEALQEMYNDYNKVIKATNAILMYGNSCSSTLDVGNGE